MVTDEMVERACKAFSEGWGEYPDGSGRAQITDWFDLDAQDAVDFGVLKDPKWDTQSDIRGMQHELYVSAVVKEAMRAALEAALEPQERKPSPAAISAFHEAYDASLEQQPRETSQAIYDGLCAAYAAQPAQERDGWKLVPVEPTEEIYRLRRMVERRDEFIISKDLWDDFKEVSREAE